MAKNNKVVFKAYSPSQALLLQPLLEELIAANHPVRIVNQVIDVVKLDKPTKAAAPPATTPVCSFMRLKDDHMGSGQLQAAYNVQLSASNQFVVNYSIHPNLTDTITLPVYLQEHQSCYG